MCHFWGSLYSWTEHMDIKSQPSGTYNMKYMKTFSWKDQNNIWELCCSVWPTEMMGTISNRLNVSMCKIHCTIGLMMPTKSLRKLYPHSHGNGDCGSMNTVSPKQHCTSTPYTLAEGQGMIWSTWHSNLCRPHTESTISWCGGTY